jgi:hypothetical protein
MPPELLVSPKVRGELGRDVMPRGRSGTQRALFVGAAGRDATGRQPETPWGHVKGRMEK